MSKQSLPAFPSLPDLRRICRRLTRAVPAVTLSGRRVVIHEVRPNNIQIGHHVKAHVHSFYESHVVLTGSARYITGGEQVIGPGGVLLHGPHTSHEWQEPDAPCLRLLIWFSMDPIVPVPRPAAWPVWPDILWDIAQLLGEAEQQARGWQDRATARLSVLISRLLTVADWPPEAVASPRSHPDFVQVIDQFLCDNLSRPLALLDIADQVGVSQRTLCRQFQEQTGTTVMEHLFTLRMDRAAALLSETDDPLSAIGDLVGMPDPSYFVKRFRKHFHVTPHVYRQQVASRGQ